MKRIGLTQRVEVTSTGERRDCLDQNWAVLFDSLKLIPVPLPNYLPREGVKNLFENHQLDGIVLTGGNDPVGFRGTNEAPERDLFEHALIEECTRSKIPVLGVCRGAEILFIHYGGKISPISDHVRVRHIVNFGSQKIEVNSYHGFGLEESSLPGSLEILARAQDDSIEAFKHTKCPQTGILWHPEREGSFQEFDLNLFRNVFGVKK